MKCSKETIMRFSLFLAAVILMGLASSSAVGQIYSEKNGDVDPLSRKVVWNNPQRTDPVSILMTYLGVVRLPGGIFLVRNCGSTEPRIIPSEKATLRDGLDQISKAMPQYKWSLEDGVINFLPQYYSPSPLDTFIAEFKADNVPIFQAFYQLFDMPEVKNGMASLGLHEPSVQLLFGSGDPPVKDQRRINLNLKNATLREVLNAIVKADGSKTWTLSVYSCNGDSTYQRALVN